MKILLLLLCALSGWSQTPAKVDVSELEKIAIQDQGRIKPFDTFSRESVILITGKSKFQGKNPTEIVLSWLLLPDTWTDQKFMEVSDLGLRKELGLSESEKYVSPTGVIQNPRLPALFNEVATRQREKRKLNSFHRSILRLNNQLGLFKEIVSGNALRLTPQMLSDDWLSITELKDEGKQLVKDISSAYVAAISKGDQAGFTKAVLDFKTYSKNQNPKAYPTDREIGVEIAYNSMHPFRWAYAAYLLASILLLISLMESQPKIPYFAGMGLVVFGFVIHAIGFGFRCWIAGRPPVSNMYESIIWVSIGTVFFGFVLELIYKKRFVIFAASIMATLALIVADNTPVTILNPHINPLEPVLRSNYWLTIHVLTITASYAAFALATGIGNVALYYFLTGQHKTQSAKVSSLALFMYRAVQVGVVLLTAGTILGGWWADYSWGRFWGWDPKETWALIADLMYLAVLHGKFTGWLRTFGTVVSTVLCFAGVIMAWYGVNFVLGAGLHSYGFGSGGMEYVLVVTSLQLGYVALAYYGYRKAETISAS